MHASSVRLDSPRRLTNAAGPHGGRRAASARSASPAARFAPASALSILGPTMVGPALAQGTYYVDGSSASCSDAGPGTQSTPYCSISAALAAHHDPGTTLNVMPGVYHEQVTIPASGTSGSPLVLKAVASAGNPVVIDGSDDFSSSSKWTQYAGNVWLASSVTWNPAQVFADGTRLTRSSAAP